MKSEKDEMNRTGENLDKPKFSLDRRELMKLGAGTAMAAALAAPSASAQRGGAGGQQRAVPAPGSMRAPGDIAPFTGPGYKNNFDRLGNNGPMDDTSRKIVKFVHDYDESKVTPSAVEWFNRTMIDSMAALIAGFELDEPRITARLASRLYPAGQEKCTILGYGVTTTPEMAALVNSVLIRETDFNDNIGGGNHVSTLIPAALAMGEALHATGKQVMTAIIIGYELTSAPVGGDPVPPAMMAGKLMGLNEDRLANAISLALIPHIELNKGVGALSMWKNVRESEPVKCGVWGALLAREGLTGNPQPYEGRGAYWSYQAAGNPNSNGMGRDFTLPARPDAMVIEWNHWFKRRPAEASSQGILLLMPEVRAWAKPDEIASIHWDTSYGNWEEICDAPKWDPRNRQTADHSLPYIIARAFLDGDIYIDSYTEAKFMDPAARALMDKTTIAPVADDGWSGNGPGRLTITKKTGETKYWDTYDGVRSPTMKQYMPMTDEELKAKFDHVCAYQKVTNAQRDQAYKVWSDISSLKDFADAMKVLTKFGQPRPL